MTQRRVEDGVLLGTAKAGEQWEKRDKHKSKAGFSSPNDTEDRESKLQSSEVSWENQKANQE